MSLQQVRFIQSGDWRLETPLGGIADVPTELREAFVEAPYLAAERVIQAALDHRVDWLLLTGNILPLDVASPYSLEFLLRQFQRLDEQGIAVYWLGADCDDVDLWPAQLSFPSCVRLFPVGRLHEIEHQRDGKTVARLLGKSTRRGVSWNASDFAGSDETVPRVAVVSGQTQKRSLEGKGVDYWALGGEERHHVVTHGATTAVYAGSPQGRTPDDTDVHGAVLVDLQFGKATTRLLETDVWRWRRERVLATEASTVDELEKLVSQQLNQIPSDTARFSWLLIWTVVCSGPLAWRLHQREARRELLESLQRKTVGDGRWSIRVESEPADVAPEWYEEDSVLGDFLRAVQRYEQDADAWQALVAFLPETTVRDELLRELKDVPDHQREELWQRVAAWGADLLRGDLVIEDAVRP